jgi:hypothetical protein
VAGFGHKQTSIVVETPFVNAAYKATGEVLSVMFPIPSAPICIDTITYRRQACPAIFITDQSLDVIEIRCFMDIKG